MNDEIWTKIHQLVQWLDENDNATPPQSRLLRLLKLQEEVGEVAQAAMGALAASPCKGRSHTWEDVRNELCDVILGPVLPHRPTSRSSRPWTGGREYAQPGTLQHFDGDALLHTDFAPDNVLIADGRARPVDWAWPTRGEAWIDPSALALRLMEAGHRRGGRLR
ncbi:MazG-like family protein [Streptomyces sp. NRRL F-5123]|uniref:MazG-like family protein n=1 Tax=Streptomyces sp. NRRL F-5123 TaxID=1463856 RepID=UPI00069462BF|nr:MazG-like family protein [Streptomyces sp. NRRL F-5123]